jgi:hypothetical protein
VNYEQTKILKKVEIADFKITSLNFPGETVDDHEKSQSAVPVTEPYFGSGTATPHPQLLHIMSYRPPIGSTYSVHRNFLHFTTLIYIILYYHCQMLELWLRMRNTFYFGPYYTWSRPAAGFATGYWHTQQIIVGKNVA